MLSIGRLLRAVQQQPPPPQQQQQLFHSTSVIATLIRLRNQFVRVGGNSHANITASTASSMGAPDAATAAPATTASTSSDAIATEALSLLSKSARASDPLSDSPSSSAHYCVEVGKLLSVGAAFRVFTTTGRVQDCLRWLEKHATDLKAARPIMSICMPLLNLQDGATNGKDFVMAHLYAPLLAALSEAAPSPKGPPEVTVAQAEREAQHQRNATVSVYLLVSKMLDIASSQGKGDTVLLEHAVTLLEHATARLEDCYSQPKTPSALSAAVLAVSECASCLQAVQLALRETRRTLPAASPRVQCVLARLIPLLDAALSVRGLAATAANRRAQDVVCLLEALLKLLVESSDGQTSSAAATTAAALPGSQIAAIEALLSRALSAVPSAVSTASARDLCGAVQAVNRIRMSSVNVEVDTQGLLNGVRPQVFLLAEAHNGQLGQVECSQLVSGLSRWEWQRSHATSAPLLKGDTAAAAPPAVTPLSSSSSSSSATTTPRVPDDLLCLLCERFTKKMPYVLPTHLIPFLQGLARMESRRHSRQGPYRRQGDTAGAAADARGVLRSTLSAVDQAVKACGRRALPLAREEGRFSVLEGASVLQSFSQLHAAPEAMDFFAAVEEQLGSVVELRTAVETNAVAKPQQPPPPQQQRGGGGGGSEKGERRATTAVLKALEAFHHCIASAAPTEETAAVAARADQLRRRVQDRVLGSVESLCTPRELMAFFSAVHPSSGGGAGTRAAKTDPKGEEEEEEEGHDDDAATEAADEGEGDDEGSPSPSSTVVTEAFPSRQFAAKVGEAAPRCTGHELAHLAMAVAYISNGVAAADKEVEEEEEEEEDSPNADGIRGELRKAAHEAMVALLARASCVSQTMTLAELKKVMDALRLSGVVERAAAREHHQDGLNRYLGALSEAAVEAMKSRTFGGCDPVQALSDVVALGKTVSAFLHQGGGGDGGGGGGGFLEEHAPALVAAFAGHATHTVHRARLLVSSPSLAASRKGFVEQLVVLAYVCSQLSAAAFLKASEQQQQQQQLYPWRRPLYSGGGGPLEGDTVAVEPETVGLHDDAEGDGGIANDGEAALREERSEVERAMGALFEGLSEALSEVVGRSREVPCLGGGVGQGEAGTLPKDPSQGEAAPLTSFLTAKQLVMLVQSLETANVPATVQNNQLLFSLLPELRTLATNMEPLEVSLLMNAMARLGVWNGRIMNRLAAEAVVRVEERCGVRQCSNVLRGMQRSGFLSSDVFLWPKRCRGGGRDAATLPGLERQRCTADSEVEHPLLSLSRAAVERLDSLVRDRGALGAVVADNPLEDLIAAVHALSFFDFPPQPTFDTYYVLAMKKLLLTLREDGEGGVAGARRMVLSVTFLASRVHHLRRADHRRVASRMLASILHTLEATSPRTALTRTFASLPLAKAAEFHQVFRTHWILHGTDLGRIPLPARALRRRRRRRSAVPRRCASSAILGMNADAFYSQLLKTKHCQQTLGPLQLFWRVLAPIPAVTAADSSLSHDTAQRLSDHVATHLATSKLTLREVVGLCDCLTRSLCGGWRSVRAHCEDTLAHTICKSLQQLLPLAAADPLVTPAQAASLLLAQSLCACGPMSEEWCGALQARPLLFHNAIDALLAFAVASRDEDTLTAVVDAGSERGKALAHSAKNLVPRLGQPSAADERSLPQLYRLLRGYGSAFLTLCVRVSTREAQGDTGAVLWEVLLRSLLVFACSESLSIHVRRGVASSILTNAGVRKCAKTSTTVQEIRALSRRLSR